VAREQDVAALGTPHGYHDGDRNGFIEIARVEGRFNRALIYPGNLLHSGLLPEGFNYSPNPRLGRLTGNIFIRALS
ncbi:MAG: histone acetyltransferase, partial [Asticcacaulis sp.]|nr:histone acetyltransferase [Asticcacaulis sp.]